MFEMLKLAERLTENLPHGQRLGCTEVQAAWCPHHGDCLCNRDDHMELDPNCPLHAEINYDWNTWPRLVSPTEGQRRICEWPDCKVDATCAGTFGGKEVVICDIHFNTLTKQDLGKFGPKFRHGRNSNIQIGLVI